MDIASLLGSLLDTLANLGIDVESIQAAIEPIIEQIMALLGPIIGG